MSYEGYVEKLCKNGHHWTEDCYGEDIDHCPRCTEPFVWQHAVDCTNGIVEDDDGNPYPDTIPWPLEVDRYETVEVQVPIYKIPVRP